MSEFPIDVIRQAERAAPSAVVGSGKFYTKDMSGVTQQFYRASDGTEYQMTPVVPGAGSVTYAQLSDLITLRPVNTLPNDANTNAIFTAGRSTATLLGSSTYRMHGQVSVTRVTGGSSTPSVVLAGTATYTSLSWHTWGYSDTVFRGVNWVQTNTAQFVNTGSANQNWVCEFEGILITNAGGTFIPSLACSPAPGSTLAVQPITYCELVLLGNSSYGSQGGWG